MRWGGEVGSAGAVSWGGEPLFATGKHALTMSKMTTPSAGGLVRTISLRRFERSRQTRFDIVLSLSVGLTRPLGSSPGRTLGSVAAVPGLSGGLQRERLKADLDFARCSHPLDPFSRFKGGARVGLLIRGDCRARSHQVPSKLNQPGHLASPPRQRGPERWRRNCAAEDRSVRPHE